MTPAAHRSHLSNAAYYRSIGWAALSAEYLAKAAEARRSLAQLQQKDA